MGEFKKELYKVIGKEASGNDKRFLNVVCYSYDGKPAKISIQPKEKNSNENCDPNKKWINKTGITGLTKEEALNLAKNLTEVANKYL